MTENTNSSGGNSVLAFIVGGVVVVLAIVAYFVFAGAAAAPRPDQVDINVKLPEVSAPALPAAPAPAG